jgi:hypothetical protein
MWYGRALRAALKEKPKGYVPSRDDLTNVTRWRLENFVADEFLKCHEGYHATGPNDDGLFQVFNRRAGPIAAAISITIDQA